MEAAFITTTVSDIPATSIICMAISGCISIFLPIILFLIFRKRFGGKLVPALVGAAVFIVFVLVLESLLHNIVFGLYPISTRPVLYITYASLAAGIFEETGRFLSFKLLKKKYNSIGNALTYGVGHGGMEAMFIVGLAMISNIIISVGFNRGSAMVMGDHIALTTATYIADMPAWRFLLSGMERMSAIAIHISLSVLVYYSVARKDKRWLYPLAIVLHALVDVPAAAMQALVIDNMILLEAIIAIAAVLLVILAIYVHKKLAPQPVSTVCSEMVAVELVEHAPDEQDV